MSIKIENLVHIYQSGTNNEQIALDDLNLDIPLGQFIGLIGHTGSGKSTLIQHLNGLISPTKGKIYIENDDITKKGFSLVDIRKKVGLVFQYPEYQLFEETVEKDVSYGPMNLNLEKEEIIERVKYALSLTGISYEDYKDKSPFELSGGQKRRVAIAGVLAMKPKILILDEPTAGLDPQGKNEILDNIKCIHEKEKNTIILVSHSMEDVSKYADKLIVMNRGKIEFFDTPQNVFKNNDRLIEIGLDIPPILKLKSMLKKNNFDISNDIFTYEDMLEYLTEYFIGGKK